MKVICCLRLCLPMTSAFVCCFHVSPCFSILQYCPPICPMLILFCFLPLLLRCFHLHSVLSVWIPSLFCPVLLCFLCFFCFSRQFFFYIAFHAFSAAFTFTLIFLSWFLCCHNFSYTHLRVSALSNVLCHHSSLSSVMCFFQWSLSHVSSLFPVFLHFISCLLFILFPCSYLCVSFKFSAYSPPKCALVREHFALHAIFGWSCVHFAHSPAALHATKSIIFTYLVSHGLCAREQKAWPWQRRAVQLSTGAI